jgi:hypothetical protein
MAEIYSCFSETPKMLKVIRGSDEVSVFYVQGIFWFYWFCGIVTHGSEGNGVKQRKNVCVEALLFSHGGNFV